MYFGPEGASPEWICTAIEEGAMILGANNTEFDEVGEWWYISADIDWLAVPSKVKTDENSIFKTIWGFPESGQNNYRSEAMARIFSSSCVTLLKQNLKIVSGESPDRESTDLLKSINKKWVRTIAFKFQKKV